MSTQIPKDQQLLRCECGSEEFLADTTDTHKVHLWADGMIAEWGKCYPGDVHNINCADCGLPADSPYNEKEVSDEPPSTSVAAPVATH